MVTDFLCVDCLRGESLDFPEYYCMLMSQYSYECDSPQVSTYCNTDEGTDKTETRSCSDYAIIQILFCRKTAKGNFKGAGNHLTKDYTYIPMLVVMIVCDYVCYPISAL